ncbi:MAG: VWA domain-containing protein [Ruminococcaceae bacterium]|nr:VWA domain-containing protein [Oscillospiraceae bacterium]
MKFLNPQGLWLLLGIPILIIIYIIKSQHENRAVSSTYLWNLSKRFQKKRFPIQRFRKILMFLLQLCMIILISLIAAKPAMVKGENYDYIAILDGSASMQIQDKHHISRFDRAVKELENLADDLSDGHTLTIILATDKAAYLVENAATASEAKLALNKAVCSYGKCNTAEAVSLAQTMCDRVDNAKVLFYTDQNYMLAGNIEVINLDKGEWNVSVESLTAEQSKESTIFTSDLISYHKDAPVTVGLRINGKIVDAQIVDCQSDTPTSVIFERKKLSTFDTAEVYVEANDALEADNAYAMCQKNQKKYNVLLASESPLYLESALNALDNCKVTLSLSLDDSELSGYDLYIFDGIFPKNYPQDGSVILFGTENLPQGLALGAKYDTAARLKRNNDIQSPLYADLILSDTYVKNYVTLIGNNSFESLLYCNSSSVCVTTKLASGRQFTVFSFDLHNSNLTLKPDFLVLMRNLVELSVPSILNSTDYTIGETVELTVIPGANKMYLQHPDGFIQHLSIAESQHTIPATAVGIYTAIIQTEQGGDYADFFVHIPKDEFTNEEDAIINIALKPHDETVKKEAISGIWFWFALAMLLILMIEWGWYSYEQY